MARYLVVAHQTAESPELRERVQEIARTDPAAEFTVLVPATPAGNLLIWEEGEAMDIARRQADVARSSLEGIGIKVVNTGVGDQNPLLAIEDELRSNPGYAAVVISTLPAGASRWLKMDLVSRAQRQLAHLDVVHVTAQPRTPAR